MYIQDYKIHPVDKNRGYHKIWLFIYAYYSLGPPFFRFAGGQSWIGRSGAGQLAAWINVIKDEG